MLKARPKGSAGWNEHSTCSIGISMRSPNHTGDQLRAIVDWMSGKFTYCIIDVTDSLERHNLMAEMGLDEADAHAAANELGDRWISENRKTIEENLRLANGAKMPVSLIRWDHWHNPSFASSFKSYQEQFKRAAKRDETFRAALDADIERFYQRRFGMLPSEVSEEQKSLSEKYLVEELAAHSLLYKQYKCATIYPGKQQESFSLVREGAVANVPSGLQNSHFTRIVVYDDKKGEPSSPSSISGHMSANSLGTKASAIVDRLLGFERDRAQNYRMASAGAGDAVIASPVWSKTLG